MADIVQCVKDLIAAGKLSSEDGDRILGRYERATARFELSGYAAGGRERASAASALSSQRASLAQRRRLRALSLIAQADVERLAASHSQGMGEGLQALISRDPWQTRDLVSVETRAGGLERFLMAHVGEGLAKLRTRAFGLTQDRELLRAVVRELHGQATGNADASAIAKTFADTAEIARQLFNENGGQIAKREDWGWSHAHDPRLVSNAADLGALQRRGMTPEQIHAANRDAWIGDVMGLLNRDKMLGEDLMPLSDGELRLLLEDTYNKISTDGLSDLTPGARGSSMLANSHQDRRFLVFKDGDAWLAYHEKYGGGDLFANLHGHLQGMAHEIALLERFGPNPDATFRHVRDLALRNGSLKPGSTKDRLLLASWNVTSGKAGATVNASLAENMTAARNFIAGARLGSAALSAASDIAFVRQALAWNGLPASRYIRELTAQLAELPAGERQKLAVRMGMGAEAWLQRGLAANRYAEVTGAGLSAKFADFTMRATGMTRWTDAELKAFGMTIMGELGDRAGSKFADLHPDLRRGLERFGIDATAWDEIRAAGVADVEGHAYVDLETIMGAEGLTVSRRQELVRRLLDYTYELSHIAVPHPGVLERAITTAGLPRGTVTGEAWRSVAQFKSFPLTIILNHVRMGIHATGNTNKAKYLGGLVIGTTIVGALVQQLKEISKGRDPRDMTAPEFWGSAFLQGGGAGVYGDFVYAGLFGQSRFGRGLWEELAGPLVGTASDLTKLTLGNVGQTMTGEDPRFVGEALRFASNNTPFFSSAWYTRLAFERMVSDQLRLAADPTSQRQMTRAIRNRQAEYGQQFWWRPGQAAPERGPELEAAVGE